MDTFFVDLIGNMIVDVIGFITGLAPGYVLILLIFFVAAIVVIYLRFFTNLLTKPKW